MAKLMKVIISMLVAGLALLQPAFVSAQQDQSAKSDEVAHWRRGQIRFAPDGKPPRSAFTAEESRALWSMTVALTVPDLAFEVGRGKLVGVTPETRETISKNLRDKLGAKLLPGDALSFLGFYDRQEAGRTVRRFQLSYKRGSTKVGIGGELVGNEPTNIVVVVAREDRKPDIAALLPANFRGKEVPSIDIIEIEGDRRTRLKTTIFTVE